jgi:hypothetical protein
LQQMEKEGEENGNLRWVASMWSGEMTDSLRKEIMTSEMEESPVDNQLFLVNDLMDAIK